MHPFGKRNAQSHSISTGTGMYIYICSSFLNALPVITLLISVLRLWLISGESSFTLFTAKPIKQTAEDTVFAHHPPLPTAIPAFFPPIEYWEV